MRNHSVSSLKAERHVRVTNVGCSVNPISSTRVSRLNTPAFVLAGKNSNETVGRADASSARAEYTLWIDSMILPMFSRLVAEGAIELEKKVNTYFAFILFNADYNFLKADLGDYKKSTGYK